jgi:hypothetical protein
MHAKGITALLQASRWLLPACALFWSIPQWAQEGVANTPPELKDFRLDPENKPAAPKPAPPEITPEVASPAPASPNTVSPKDAPFKRETETRAPPKPAIDTAKPVAKRELVPTPADTGVDIPSTAEPVTQTEDSPPPLVVEPEQTDASTTTSTLPPVPWIEIAAAMLALSLGGLALLLYRRKLSEKSRLEVHRPALADHIPAPDIPMPDRLALDKPKPSVQSKTTAEPVKPPKAAKRPVLDISFIPSNAIISFQSLTIKGELRIINQSKTPAKRMRLRAAIISASEVQDDIIRNFHSSRKQGPMGDNGEGNGEGYGDDLGPAAGDERVGMQIELSIPLSELKTYPLGDQQLFVPIILANVDYEWGSKAESDQARITCMVGREANPPQPKMGPFRLDLGPRRFASLGQRPLFA